MNESDYRLLESVTTSELVAAVKNLMAEGYEPVGGLVIHETSAGTLYLQAVMKRANPPKQN